MSCAFRVEDVRAQHRRTLVSLGRYRRLSDFTTASLSFLRDNLLLRSVLTPEELRPRAAGTWHGTPALSALQAHLQRLNRDHPESGLRLVTSAPGAPLALLANLWIGGRTALAFGAGGGGLSALNARLDDARTMFGRFIADAPTAVDALAQALRAVDEAPATSAAPALVVCAVDVERAESRFLDGAATVLRGAHGAVLPILVRQGRIGVTEGYGSMDTDALAASLGAVGFAVREVDIGLQFEARLYTALEWALHAARGEEVEGEAAEGHPLIILGVPRSLGMPPVLSTALDSEGTALPSLLRADAALFDTFRGWLEGYVPYDLVEVDGRPDKDLLDLLARTAEP